MKRRFLVAPLAFALLVGAGACDGMLEETPFSIKTEETFYKTRTDAVTLLSSAYRYVNGYNTTYSNPTDGILYGWSASLGLESSSDLANAHPSDQNNLAQCPGTLTCDATITPIVSPYGALYNLIYRANLVIDHIPQIEGMTDAEKGQFVAEAKFLRAFAYNHLEKRYGDVPIYLTAAPATDDAGRARKPHAEVHAQVIKDATEAEAVLPATRPAAEWGRATKGAARALLADRYVWNASRWNVQADWQKALDWSNTIITSGTYALQTNYINAFLPTNKGNSEVIFVRTSSGVDTRSSVDTRTMYWPRELTGSSGNGTTTPTAWAFSGVYEPGDYRKEQNFRVSGCNQAGTTCFNNGFPQGPHPYKFRPTNLTNGVANDVDYTIWRIADIYLFRAEARAALGDAAGSIADLNVLRARARNGAGTESRAVPRNLTLADVPTGVALRDAIYNERTRELIWEMKRWFDLVRRDTQDPGYFANELRAHDPEARRRNDPATQRFRKLLPLPQREIDLLQGVLCQNKGYGGAQCEVDIEISK
jgi:starch-binding outer membrane protein, SusD/RagB family